MHQSTIPDVGVRDLLAVLTVSQTGSFMAASLSLNMSQPALTRTVQRVEKALGVALFHRTTRRVEITAAGREFVMVVERMLNDLRITSRNMREVSEALRGQVIVSTVMSFAQTTLAPVVAQSRKDRPGIEIHIREGVHGDVVEDIRRGTADFGITYMGDLPQGIASEPFGAEGFFVLLPSKHRLTKKRSIEMAQFKGVPMVSFSSNSRTRRLIENAAALAGVILDQSVTVGQFSTLVCLVAANVGVAIVPGAVVQQARLAGLEARPIVAPRITRELGTIWLAHREMSPAARGLYGLLERSLKDSVRKSL